MLEESNHKIFTDLIQNASKDQLVWMNDCIAKLLPAQPNSFAVGNSTVNKITIVYGTETGNSKRLATDFATKAKQKSIHAKVIGMDQYRLSDLTKEEYLLALISTHGEGEPPIAAKKFYDHIHQNGFKLNSLKYSVLALGDTSYPLYCKTGEEMDEQFEKLGGVRIAPMQKCDVEYETDANAWFNEVLENLSSPRIGISQDDVFVNIAPVITKKSGKQTYTGDVLTKINLNDRGSSKETWHVEIAAEGVEYLCGDSIGIVPENPSKIVDAILNVTGVDPSKIINFKNETFTFYDLLKYKINIVYLTERLVKQYAEITQQEIPVGRMNLLDLLKIYPVKDVAQFEEIVLKMNAISPRLYTIASSPSAHEGEIHVVVVKDTYEVNGETEFGLCSDYLSQILTEGKQKFFVQPNKRFRLPAQDKNIIMVGPGTGIAAFRSFLAERDATGATGKNWLFFGGQRFASDFLYQTEIQNWYEMGVLTKVNLAFSRDQKEKLYVQHKMLQNSTEIYDWLLNGAYFFVCGTKDPMSVDVENALLKIIEQEGNKTSEEAKIFLEQMEEEGRYEKDVY